MSVYLYNFIRQSNTLTKIWTTFIDDTPALLREGPIKNRSQKILRYLGDMVVNGSRVKGQKVCQTYVLYGNILTYEKKTGTPNATNGNPNPDHP